MRIVGWALFWAVIGLVGGYVVAMVVGVVAFQVFQVSQREGAAAMGLAFVIAPAFAIVAAGAAAITAAVVTHRREKLRRNGQFVPPRQWTPAVRALVGGTVGLAAGFCAALLARSIVVIAWDWSPDLGVAVAVAHTWAPIIGAVAGAGLGLWLMRRDTGPPGGGVSG